MSDFTSITLQANTGASDSAVTWTSLAFGGTAGANEIRFCGSGAGSGSLSYTNWPYFTRPSSGTTTISEAWAYVTDGSGGAKINTYTATNANANVFRWNWDNTGTMASAPQFGAFANSTHTAPSAGTQPPGTNNDAITNGQASDTSSTSYLKATAYGTLGIANLTAGTTGTGLSATAGSAGAVTTSAGAWCAWQSLQGFVQYIAYSATPAATTANCWNFSLALYTGVNMSTGTITPVLTFQYTFV